MTGNSARRDIGRPAVVFALILMIAIAARAVGLGSGLWHDEITTLLNFVRSPLLELVSDYSSLNNHPLYSLFAKGTVSAFGESAVTLRLPAALFGVAAIAAFLPIARRAVGLWPAFLTLLLLAISYHHVWFSQNARGYTLLLFWTTLATILFLDGSKRNRAVTWAAYGGVFAAAMYTHLSAAFYFAAHGVIYAGFLFSRVVLKKGSAQALAGPRPFLAMALGVLLTLFAYAPMLRSMGSTFGGVRETPPDAPLAQWNDPLFVFQNLIEQFVGLGPLMAFALPPAIVLAAYGVYIIWKRSRLLAAIYVLQIPITIAVLGVVGMRIWPRYFFVEISFLYLALVAGAMAAAAVIGGYIERRWKLAWAPRFLTAAAATAMVLGSLPLLARNYAAPKQDLAGAVAAINREASAGDVRTVYGVSAAPVIGYLAPDWRELTAEMIDAMNGEERVWVLVAFRDQVSGADPETWRSFEEKFSLEKRLPGTLGGGGVFIYVSKSP